MAATCSNVVPTVKMAAMCSSVVPKVKSEEQWINACPPDFPIFMQSRVPCLGRVLPVFKVHLPTSMINRITPRNDHSPIKSRKDPFEAPVSGNLTLCHTDKMNHHNNNHHHQNNNICTCWDSGTEGGQFFGGQISRLSYWSDVWES